MQAVYEAAKTKAKEDGRTLPDVDYTNPNWVKGLKGTDAVDYLNDVLQDEESPMYASRRAEGAFITSGDPEYNKFEKGLMNYVGGGLPYGMTGYLIPPEGNVDIGFNPDKNFGQMGLAGLKVEDISISASGIAGGVSGPQDYLILNLSGKKAVVVGRSNLNGKPMTQLLLKENCTVTITHSKTKDLKGECLKGDIIVAAVGIPELVKGDWVKKDAIVIDVGINKTDKGIVGDVAFDEVSKIAKALTPVPGGVGPMTIACLLKNTIECFKRSQK